MASPSGGSGVHEGDVSEPALGGARTRHHKTTATTTARALTAAAFADISGENARAAREPPPGGSRVSAVGIEGKRRVPSSPQISGDSSGDSPPASFPE